ncbi:UPF0496 protein [Cinnamomum micranthum f. kanehirae]|uniref:UPF0496 protein n=1 Tax=Cinnamomum micranthum f. kanehirae TaxID=337451 RepID=A0A3S3MX93_9MAGN|nr:UPF0496 protein [Cinnamomum micranthum f. kanehirae]
MTKKFSIFRKRIFRICRASKPSTENHATTLDLREEYANAFRTESYLEFWTRVLDLTSDDVATRNSMESTAAARLPSYRLFAEYLLDPDQPTVTKILALAQPQSRPENHSLLSDYFSKTAEASLLCSLLLKDIEQTRHQYRLLKTALRLPENHFPEVANELASIANTLNPFDSSTPSPHRFRAVHAACAGLLKRLESRRDKTQARVKLAKGWKRSLAIGLVVLTASVATFAFVMGAHILIVFVSVPALLPASARRLARMSAQLDAATKGAYILNRDLDTMSRLVDRVHDELEHLRSIVQFCMERQEDRVQMIQGVLHELRKNSLSFTNQLDELEEHLYLSFMTINRARNLVMKEVMEPSCV